MCATINHKQNQSNDKNVTNFRNTPLKQTINIPEPRSIQWDPFLNRQVHQMSYFHPIKHGSDTSLSTWWSCPKELFDQNSIYLTFKVLDTVSENRFRKERNDLMTWTKHYKVSSILTHWASRFFPRKEPHKVGSKLSYVPKSFYKLCFKMVW